MGIFSKWKWEDYVRVADSVIGVAKSVPGGAAKVDAVTNQVTETIVPMAEEAAKGIASSWIKKNWYVLAIPIVAIVYFVFMKKK